jgi:ubiquitin carboxyl-terminal hydrolase L3
LRGRFRRANGAMHALSIKENWVGLESNPEVLTEYAHKLGMDKTWGFSDVVGLDDESLQHVPAPCVGLIFLYPFAQLAEHKRKRGASRGAPVDGVWYMSQTIGNACGAVALMHTVMNCMDRVSKGSGKLEAFRKEAKGASAAQRGKLFGEAMRDVHDNMADKGQTDAPRANADLEFHFVSLGKREAPPPFHPRAPPARGAHPGGACASPRRSVGGRHAVRARRQQRRPDRPRADRGRRGRLPSDSGRAPEAGVHRAVPRLALLADRAHAGRAALRLSPPSEPTHNGPRAFTTRRDRARRGSSLHLAAWQRSSRPIARATSAMERRKMRWLPGWCDASVYAVKPPLTSTTAHVWVCGSRVCGLGSAARGRAERPARAELDVSGGRGARAAGARSLCCRSYPRILRTRRCIKTFMLRPVAVCARRRRPGAVFASVKFYIVILQNVNLRKFTVKDGEAT